MKRAADITPAQVGKSRDDCVICGNVGWACEECGATSCFSCQAAWTPGEDACELCNRPFGGVAATPAFAAFAATKKPKVVKVREKAEGKKTAVSPAKASAGEKEAAVKAFEKETRELKKMIGDALKEGLRVPNCRKILTSNLQCGRLVFRSVSLDAFQILFDRPIPEARSHTAVGPFRLIKRELIDSFGKSNIVKGGGARDDRLDCAEATFEWKRDAPQLTGLHGSPGTIFAQYRPDFKGSNLVGKLKK